MYCPTCKAQYEQGAFCANDGTALIQGGDAGLVGQILAERYRIVRLLGEGGMGQVYEAKHLNINKRFAIKLLRPEVIGSPQSLQRFRQEAWAASSIGHENIVEIDDFATLPSGQVYLAMEFLDGLSLAERMRDGEPLAVADAVAVAMAVGRGLAAAHDKGIVHRDMKPENVFLARKGARVVAKILDFGIAKMTGGDEPSNLTRTGAIFGTPLYMSPEQARGKPADARADVYAVGVMLYELLTGSVPFGGESSVEILNQHIAAAPVPPSELAPDRAPPPALEALVLRALAKEPEARFATMAEMVQGLEAVAASLPAPDLSGLLPPSLASPPSGATPQLGTPSSRAATPTPSGAPRAVVPTPAPRYPVRTPTPRDPVRTPTGPTAAQGAAPSRSAISRPAISPPALAEAPPAASALDLPPGHGRRNAAIAVALLAGLGGGGYLLLAHPAAAPTTAATTSQPTTAAPSPTPAAAPLQSKAAAPEVEVILDSLPTGAKIVRDGEVIAETPEALKLAGVTSLLLRKDGYADKPVVVDPGKTRKLMVKLERVKAVAIKAPAPLKATTTPSSSSTAPGKSATAPVKSATTPPVKGATTPPVKSATTTAAKSATTPPTRLATAAGAAPRAGEPLEPYKSTPRPPPAPRAPADELGARVEKQAAQLLAGGHRLGAIYRGAAAEEGGRSDWFVQLENARCYTFVGEGGDGVKALYLYLWGPGGRRVRDTRESTPHAQMTYCTVVPGSFHFQAKVDDGQGEYRVGIYTR